MNNPRKLTPIDQLILIKGIGKQTLLDLKAIYPNTEALIRDLRADKHIPLRDDVVAILKRKLRKYYEQV